MNARIYTLPVRDRHVAGERIHIEPTRAERMHAAGFKRRNTYLPSDE